LKGVVVVIDTTMVGVQANNISGSEGSEAVAASPSRRGEACDQD
jgi:hypothetical protein